MTVDKIQGALMGTAVGDALGMPVEGFSHQNVRTYYKGIKEYRGDERRGGLRAGQWTDDTQLTFAVARVMCTSIEGAPRHLEREYVTLRPQARRWGSTTTAAVDRLVSGGDGQGPDTVPVPTNGAAMRAAPLGVWWAISGAAPKHAVEVLKPILTVTHEHPAALAAGLGQAFAIQYALKHDPEDFNGPVFWRDLMDTVQAVEGRLGSLDTSVSSRLVLLADHLDDFPLDLQDLCNGTGVAADESWPFAVAMFARNPLLIEATLLSTINVGGDADTTGAMVGALLGALHGWSRFPPAWRNGLEAVDRLEAESADFARHALSRWRMPQDD